MKRYLLPSVALLGVVLLALALVAISRERLDRGRVYTVAQVQAGLAHRPGAWLGRTVRVRGRAEGCYPMPAPIASHCARSELLVGDPDGGATTEPLLLARGDPSPALAFLRRLPLVGRLAPASQQLRWGALATYRVRPRAAPTPVCGMAPCYEVLLLDAAPDSL